MQSRKLRLKLWELRKKLPKLEKEAQGFKFKYTDLEAILKVVEPLLIKENLGYDHTTKISGTNNVLVTTIFDTKDTEEEFISEMLIPDGVSLAGMNAYQSLGSALTYFRRYSLLVTLGILTGEDVDIMKKDKAVTPPKVDYIKKIKSLITLGRKKHQLENYFEQYKERMSKAEVDIIVGIINELE